MKKRPEHVFVSAMTPIVIVAAMILLISGIGIFVLAVRNSWWWMLHWQ